MDKNNNKFVPKDNSNFNENIIITSILLLILEMKIQMRKNLKKKICQMKTKKH